MNALADKVQGMPHSDTHSITYGHVIQQASLQK